MLYTIYLNSKNMTCSLFNNAVLHENGAHSAKAILDEKNLIAFLNTAHLIYLKSIQF